MNKTIWRGPTNIKIGNGVEIMDPELVFVDFVVRQLVDHPSEVKIEKTIDEKGVLLKLYVDPSDLGRVLGKRGATAQSIRTLLRALGSRNNARYNLKVVDVDREESEAE